MAKRVAEGKALTAIAARLPAIGGDSADPDPSTLTTMVGLGVFAPTAEPDEQGVPNEAWSYTGRNLHFGVREHAMGAIANRMAVAFRSRQPPSPSRTTCAHPCGLQR